MFDITKNYNKRFIEYSEYEKCGIENNWIMPESMITALDVAQITASSDNNSTAIYRAYCYGFMVANSFEPQCDQQQPEPTPDDVTRSDAFNAEQKALACLWRKVLKVLSEQEDDTHE